MIMIESGAAMPSPLSRTDERASATVGNIEMDSHPALRPTRRRWPIALLLGLLAFAALVSASPTQAQQGQSVSLTATVNAGWTVDIALSNAPADWWFRINSSGYCTKAPGPNITGIQGYTTGSHTVWAYSDSACANEIATTTFSIGSASLSATTNSDRSVDLTLSNGPPNWWFKINSSGTCTAASGTTVSSISGYLGGTHSVWAYSNSNCGTQIATTTFAIPHASLSAVVNNDRSVDLTLSDGPSSWWFRINSSGGCTAVTGDTISGIQGYQTGTYNVWAYSNSGCNSQIAATTFTIQPASLTTTVNEDRSVDLTLSDGPSSWWFRINSGSCTAAPGPTASGIRGYQAGTHDVRAYSNSGCNYLIASSSFTIPTASLTTTVTDNLSVDLNLSNGPPNWWFRINQGGTCTAASGTTFSGIQGYQVGTHNVWAYSNSGCSYQIASSSFTIAAPDPGDPPAAPGQFTITRVCDDWFHVSWTASPGATGYDLNYSVSNGQSWTRVVTDFHSTGLIIGSWMKDSTYRFAVRALNADGHSGWTDSAPSQPPPCAVGNLRAATGTTYGADGGTISASWNAGKRADAYHVDYRADGGEWQRSASNLAATTHSMSVTTRGGYAVGVQSLKGGLASPLSTAQVAWLTADGITQTAATLTLAGHSGDWYVQETSPSTGACSSAISGGTHGLSTLSDSTTYTYTAYRDSGCADAIGSASFTTAAPTPPSQLAAPALTTGDGLLAIAWTQPSDLGGSPVTDYDVRYRAVSATNWSYVFFNEVSYSPGHLGNGKQSNGSSGQALDLGTVSFTDPTVTLTVTKVTTGGISNVYKISEAVGGFGLKLYVKSGGNNTYVARYADTAPTTSNMNSHGTLLWTRSAGTGHKFTEVARTAALPANTHFWITTTAWGKSDIVTPTVTADTASPSSLAAQVSGLTNGTSYEVQARAVNAIGQGAWSASATHTAGVPGRPTALTAVSGNGQLTVYWTAPADNGSAITDYDLRYSSDSGNSWTEFENGTDTTPVQTITGLTNGSTYLVQARASNAHGDSLWSLSSSPVMAGAPNQPAAPTIIASGNQQLTVAWVAPSDNGSPITGYRVIYSPDNATWSNWSHSGTGVTTTITGLTNNQTYYVRVQATNGRATGAWSSSASDKPGRPPAPSTPTLTAGQRQLTATWTAPATNGLAITDYDVQYRKSERDELVGPGRTTARRSRPRSRAWMASSRTTCGCGRRVRRATGRGRPPPLCRRTRASPTRPPRRRCCWAPVRSRCSGPPRTTAARHCRASRCSTRSRRFRPGRRTRSHRQDQRPRPRSAA